MLPEELYYEIALTQVPKIGNKISKLLIAYCGGAEAVFKEKKKNLLRINGVGPHIAKALENESCFKKAAENIEFLQNKKYEVSYYLNDPNYPKRMSQYDDAPIIVYQKGNANLNPARTVSIVGTRKPTNYGKSTTDQIVSDLKNYNVQIISGLAYGVDSQAHLTCVKNDIENIAVMGTGLDKVYPATNRSLADKIVNRGALITEFPINTKPDRENFPMRNRIIAAMSDVVIVIQSASKGGSLITAEFANAYYKDVFAVPGRITDEMSMGCNKLIKINKAHLLESVEDIAYIMRWDTAPIEQNNQTELFQSLSTEEEVIVNILKKNEEIAIDQLHHLTEMNLSDLAGHLLSLEFNNIVTALPGKKYALR